MELKFVLFENALKVLKAFWILHYLFPWIFKHIVVFTVYTLLFNLTTSQKIHIFVKFLKCDVRNLMLKYKQNSVDACFIIIICSH